MNSISTQLDHLIARAKAGELSWSDLAERLLAQAQQAGGPTEHCPDFDRARRCRFGEVIFGEGKSQAAMRHISRQLLDSGQGEVLITRIDAGSVGPVAAEFEHARADSLGRTLRLSDRPIAQQPLAPLPCPEVIVVTAGSTDLPVAREAAETLGWMQVPSDLITDVGVAGPYRLLAHIERLRTAAAVVVIAGMEGALASVVGGLVPCPVIAVPTSVGYGANFEGITTLLSMMSSCAAGVSVVNIDAGFKGAYIAGLIGAGYATARNDHPD